jgi:hypothetical protein
LLALATLAAVAAGPLPAAHLVAAGGPDGTDAVRRPDQLVSVMYRYPNRQDVESLTASGVEFLFLSVAQYPDRWQAGELAAFQGTVHTIIATHGAPDTWQVDAVNMLKGKVTLLLSAYPDSFAVDRLQRLGEGVSLYLFAHQHPGSFEATNLNRVGRPLRLVISGGYPDSFAARRLDELADGIRVTLNVVQHPDSWTVNTLNSIKRPMALYIGQVTLPGSWEAANLAQLAATYTVFLGRSFTAASVLERLLAALEAH